MKEYNPLVLLVEDNPDVMRLNKRAFTRAGYRVLCSETLADTETILRTGTCDVMVLDILLPDGNALKALPRLRMYSDAPVLFLSSLNEHKDVLDGIEAGGDDYMTKPHKLDELLARVTALWRREKLHREQMSKNASQMLFCGPLTLNLVSNTAYLCGTDMLLTGKEFAVLLLLAQNQGKTLAKEAIYEKVWGQTMNNDSQALYVVVSRLKKKLEPAGGAIRLTTLRPSGYQLTID